MGDYKTANKYKSINRDDVDDWTRRDAPEWVKALMIFLYLYGIRIGEALKIRREDLIESDEYLLLLAPAVALEKNQDPYPRRLPISLKAPGMTHLKKYLETVKTGELIFPFSRSWSWVQINKIDPELSPHVFRHNRATEFFLQDASEVEVQAWLGHTDSRMSSKYRHKSGVFTEKLGRRSVIL